LAINQRRISILMVTNRKDGIKTKFREILYKRDELTMKCVDVFMRKGYSDVAKLEEVLDEQELLIVDANLTFSQRICELIESDEQFVEVYLDFFLGDDYNSDSNKTINVEALVELEREQLSIFEELSFIVKGKGVDA